MASSSKTARKSRKNNVPADAPVIEVSNGLVVDPSAPVVDVTPAGNETPVVEEAPAPAAAEPAAVQEPAAEPEEEPRQVMEPLPYDLRQGDPCVVTVGFKPRRLDWHAIVVSKHATDGVVVVQLQETVPPGDAVPGTVPPGDDGIRQVSVRVLRPAPVALTYPEREILAELWFASETNQHDFGLLADLLGIDEPARVSRCRLLEAKGLITCDDQYEQFTFTDRGRDLFVSFNDGPDLKEQNVMSKNKRPDQRGNMVEVEHGPAGAATPGPASAAATKPAGGTATATAPRKGRKPAARPVEDQAPPQEELEHQEESPLEKPTAPRRGKPAKPAKGKVAEEAPAKPAKPAKVAAESTNGEKHTVRVRILEALAESGEEMTASQVQAAIGLGHGLKPTLDQEVERGHALYGPTEDGTATYKISPAGRKALANGTVNPRRGTTAK